MAEVRPIPSAVGAFEAQVIDFNKTYKAIVDNAAAIRKRQAQAQKDIEKQLELMMVDKRTTRSQDENVVFNARKEANDFYYNNKPSLDAGDIAKRKQLNEKIAKATSLITKSVSERIEDEKTLPVLKEAMKDANYYEDDLVELIRKRELPLDEREGLTFDRNGVATPIDQFNVTDLKYMKKFDEVKLDDAITRNVKPYTPDKMTLTKNPKLGVYADQLTETRIYDPYGIVGQTESFANTQPKGFLRHYAPQLAVYKSLPELERQSEFNGVMDAYKDLSGVDMRPWFQKGDGQFIDNELELAAFKKLQAKMPQVIKDTYDYRTQNMLFNQSKLFLSRQKFAQYLKDKEDNLDVTWTNKIMSKNYNPEEVDEYFNTISKEDVRFGFKPAEIKTTKLPNGNYSSVVSENRLMYDQKGDPITSIDVASKMLQSGTSAILSSTGFYYVQKKHNFEYNPKNKTNTGGAVGGMLDVIIDVQTNQETKKSLSGQRQSLKDNNLLID